MVVADLAKPFNEQDLRGEIIFDEQFGLCPRVKPPHTGRRYPSLPHWLAQRHQRREQRGEELRLLYVAMTRARDTLILTADRFGEKMGNALVETGGHHHSGHCLGEKLRGLAGDVVRSPQSAVHSPKS